MSCGYVGHDETLQQAKERYQYHSCMSSVVGYFDDVSSWQQLCRARYLLDRRTGRRSAATSCTETLELWPQRQYLRPRRAREDAWRLKLDPWDHCVVVTGRRGSLRTLDAETGEELWAVEPSPRRTYTHLEWSCGWLVVDRGGGAFTRLTQRRTNSRSGAASGCATRSPLRSAAPIVYTPYLMWIVPCSHSGASFRRSAARRKMATCWSTTCPAPRSSARHPSRARW